MAEVMKHNGDVDSALKDSKKTGSTLDISKLQELAKNANTQSNNTTEQYQLKR
jgi:hypothetical protein